MLLSDFDYHLPRERIAQQPAKKRDASRLMVVPHAHGDFAHASFADIAKLLPAGALVVVNDTRVIPARLFARKPTGGRVELLMIEKTETREVGAQETWLALVRSNVAPNTSLSLEAPNDARTGARARAQRPEVVFRQRRADGTALLDVTSEAGLLPVLDDWGALPLPQYIERAAGATSADDERYQTVFAAEPGAVAAPTAGLHFTRALLAEVRAKCQIEKVTLHVGPGTFSPVRTERIAEHRMHSERYFVPGKTADAFSLARKDKRSVVAVGTTVVRTLESAWASGKLTAGTGQTRLFVTPGYVFRAVDHVITNFHLPRSTLLMLVCAFAGTERALSAYREAIAREYRFYSYGDAMLLW